jgi:hypothetical protein
MQPSEGLVQMDGGPRVLDVVKRRDGLLCVVVQGPEQLPVRERHGKQRWHTAGNGLLVLRLRRRWMMSLAWQQAVDRKQFQR